MSHMTEALGRIMMGSVVRTMNGADYLVTYVGVTSPTAAPDAAWNLIGIRNADPRYDEGIVGNRYFGDSMKLEDIVDLLGREGVLAVWDDLDVWMEMVIRS